MGREAGDGDLREMKGCQLAVKRRGGGGHLCSQEKSPEGLKRREKPMTTGAGPEVVDQLDPETVKAKGWGEKTWEDKAPRSQLGSQEWDRRGGA